MPAIIATKAKAANPRRDGSCICKVPTTSGTAFNDNVIYQDRAYTNNPSPDELQKKGHMRNSWDPNAYGE